LGQGERLQEELICVGLARPKGIKILSHSRKHEKLLESPIKKKKRYVEKEEKRKERKSWDILSKILRRKDQTQFVLLYKWGLQGIANDQNYKGGGEGVK